MITDSASPSQIVLSALGPIRDRFCLLVALFLVVAYQVLKLKKSTIVTKVGVRKLPTEIKVGPAIIPSVVNRDAATAIVAASDGAQAQAATSTTTPPTTSAIMREVTAPSVVPGPAQHPATVDSAMLGKHKMEVPARATSPSTVTTAAPIGAQRTYHSQFHQWKIRHIIQLQRRRRL